jgi:hypothetical protein
VFSVAEGVMSQLVVVIKYCMTNATAGVRLSIFVANPDLVLFNLLARSTRCSAKELPYIKPLRYRSIEEKYMNKRPRFALSTAEVENIVMVLCPAVSGPAFISPGLGPAGQSWNGESTFSNLKTHNAPLKFIPGTDPIRISKESPVAEGSESSGIIIPGLRFAVVAASHAVVSIGTVRLTGPSMPAEFLVYKGPLSLAVLYMLIINNA